MGVKHTTKKNLIPRMVKQAQALNGKKVEVGVFDGDHAWLAGIHEYGCTITPKNGKYLTIPCNKKAAESSARSFSNLFFLELKDGSKWLVREKGKDQLEFMYQLATSVTIPERSFLRSGFDSCHKEVIGEFEKVLPDYLVSGQHVETILKQCGKQLASQIKKYARDLKDPPKQKITIASYGGGKKNPLVKTGEMINSITYRIEDE